MICKRYSQLRFAGREKWIPSIGDREVGGGWKEERGKREERQTLIISVNVTVRPNDKIKPKIPQ